MKVGLTGGMGCGKSLVCDIFREQGWKVVKTDVVVRNILEFEPDIIDTLVQRFGGSILDKTGSIDRAKLAKRVFNNDVELEFLESVLHPRVRELWSQAMLEEPDKNWVIEIPLLFEKNLEKHFDIVICVTASLQVQLQRLAKRGFTAEQAMARIARQLPLPEKERRADFVISNNGSIDFTRSQAAQLLFLLNFA